MCPCYFQIMSPGGDRSWVKTDPKHTTVGEFKKKAMKEFLDSGHDVSDVTVISDGKPLDSDSESLSDCGVKPSSVLQMVRKVEGG